MNSGRCALFDRNSARPVLCLNDERRTIASKCLKHRPQSHNYQPPFVTSERSNHALFVCDCHNSLWSYRLNPFSFKTQHFSILLPHLFDLWTTAIVTSSNVSPTDH